MQAWGLQCRQALPCRLNSAEVGAASGEQSLDSRALRCIKVLCECTPAPVGVGIALSAGAAVSCLWEDAAEGCDDTSIGPDFREL